MGLLGTIGSVVGSAFGAPWLGAVGSGVDSILSDASPYVSAYASYQGQQNANDTNVMLAQQNRDWSTAEAQKSRDFSSDQAQRQMDFQREMSSSAYQRATSDMRAAGINPMLAFSQGGASSPAGAAGASAMPSAAAARVENAAGAGVNSALQAGALQSNIRLQNSQALLNAASAKRQDADARLGAVTAEEAERTMRGRESLSDAPPGEVSQWWWRNRARLDAREHSGRARSAEGRGEADEVHGWLSTAAYGADLDLRKAISTLKTLEIPESSAYANYWGSTLGKAFPYGEGVKALLPAVGYHSARGRSFGGGVGFSDSRSFSVR